MTEDQDQKFDKRLLIIFLILFTEVLGFSSVLPLIPFLGISLGLDAFQVGLILSIFSICQLFASPITGKLSDRYGRKPLLIFSQTSTLIGFLLLGFATNVWILIAARIVDGLLGSNMTVSQAYISDVTKPKNRTKVFGYSSAVMGVGLIFGPVIGGLLSAINFSFPMLFAAGVSLISIILVLGLLPESLTEKEDKLELKLKNIFPFKETKQFSKAPKIRGILVIFFFYSLGFFLIISTYALFAEKQIHISVQEVSFNIAWIGLLRVIFQSVLIGPILKKASENTTLKLGIFALIFSMAFLSFTTNPWIVYIPLSFFAFGTGVTRPILTSKLTKAVKREETGSLLGVNNALGSLAQVIAPILGGVTLQFLPTPTFPILTVVIFGLMFLLWRWAFIKPTRSEEKQIIKKVQM
ncbi:MAG: MFS transporter [Promethearchaeota archaeon]|jgi:DHA1 family tetracycline resistance protein-like MFS transporter